MMPEPDAESFRDYFLSRFSLPNGWQAFQPVAKYLSNFGANERFHHLFPLLTEDPPYRHEIQNVAAGLMMKVDAGCPISVRDAVLEVLDKLDPSVPEFPFFLVKHHGRESVLKELRELSGHDLSESQRRRLETLLYWTRGFTEERYEDLRQRWSARIRG